MFAKLINKSLSVINLTLIRKSTFLKLIDNASQFNGSVNNSSITNDSIKESLTNFEKKIIQNQTSIKWEVIDALERLIPVSKNLTCELCSHSGDIDSFQKFDAYCAFSGGVLHRYQCPHCDVIFGPDKIFQLSELELTNEYERHYSVYQEGDSTEQELRAFNCLNPQRDGVYLNYGGGAWSRSVEILREDGWNVYVYEPHISASSGYDYVINEKSRLSKMQFDGIYSNNVLEHLRNPIYELNFISSLLKPDAKMAHATPCFEYLYDYTRFHVFFYLGRSRDYVIKKSGLIEKDFIKDDEFMCTILERK